MYKYCQCQPNRWTQKGREKLLVTFECWKVIFAFCDKNPWAVTSCLNEDPVPTADWELDHNWYLATGSHCLLSPGLSTLYTDNVYPAVQLCHWSLRWSLWPPIGWRGSSRKITIIPVARNFTLYFPAVKYREDETENTCESWLMALLGIRWLNIKSWRLMSLLTIKPLF